MRTAFVKTLLALAQEHSDIMLVTGDLGFTVLEEFRDTLPKQYLNAGVAEQNMIGVAAGLALCGKRVFVYSIIPFATYRCLEQTRNDVCYHNLPVCVVGVGAGYSYGYQGSTHHALEDISVMRSLPNISVVCPGDPLEAAAAVRAIAEARTPAYLRLGKAGEPNIHTSMPDFHLGKALRLSDGKDLTIIATSTMLETGKAAADLLIKEGHSVRFVSMPCVKPIDEEEIARAATETKLIVTIEEHGSIGGLGLCLLH
jgi:transketolase